MHGIFQNEEHELFAFKTIECTLRNMNATGTKRPLVSEDWDNLLRVAKKEYREHYDGFCIDFRRNSYPGGTPGCVCLDCRKRLDKFIATFFLALNHRLLRTIADKFGLPDVFADLVVHCLAPVRYTNYDDERAPSQWRFYPKQIARVLQDHTAKMPKKTGRKRKRKTSGACPAEHPALQAAQKEKEARLQDDDTWRLEHIAPPPTSWSTPSTTFDSQFAPFFGCYRALPAPVQ